METFPELLAICARNSPVTGEFHTQRPVTQSFDVYFDLRLNKQSTIMRLVIWGWWFEMLSHPLWHHCNGIYFSCCFVVGYKKMLNHQAISIHSANQIPIALDQFHKYIAFIANSIIFWYKKLPSCLRVIQSHFIMATESAAKDSTGCHRKISSA